MKFIEKLFARNISTRRLSYNLALGREGEFLAREYLLKKGLKLICSNFKFKNREIDLIFYDRKNKIIIFVEVKTRSDDFLGLPEDAINRRKQNNIKHAARDFLIQHPEFNSYDIRFDSVSVLKKGAAVYINHIENAF